jgi:hypothetical protein
MRQPPTYSRALGRAAEIAGGIDALAAKLDVAPILVRSWISGTLEVPIPVFLTVVDLLMDNELRQMREPPQDAPAKISQLRDSAIGEDA